MTEWIACIVAIVAAMVLLPWMLSGMNKGKGGGGVGNALLELDGILNPSAQHQVEARQQPVKPSPPKADPPDDEGKVAGRE